MSALTSLFTSMANKIRSKVGGSDTYTPTEMVSAIDDVYDAGIADATTPITPSNASPAGMTANVGYKPTANGYAISNYNNVTPSNSSPVALTSGDIDKMGANGYAISSYSEIAPDDIYPMQLVLGSIYKIRGYNGYAIKSYPSLVSPSNSSPAALTYGKMYRINATDGYAIKNYTPVTPSSTPISVASGTIVKMEDSGKIVDAISDVTPSDSSPVAVTSGLTYKMGGGGYAIESQPSSKTPDDTTPPTVSSGEIVKMGGAGYLYATQQGETETTLWTNASPTSGFTNQEVTLSDNYTNYKRIRFYFRASNSVSDEFSVEYKKEEIDKWFYGTGSSGTTYPAGSITFNYSSTNYSRLIRKTGSSVTNKFYIATGQKLGASGTAQNTGIPTRIVGIN